MFLCPEWRRRAIQDTGVDLRMSRHMVRQATSERPWPPTRLAEGSDRAQDHVRDDLRTGDHDHMGAFNLGDLPPGPRAHKTYPPAPAPFAAPPPPAQGGKFL